MKKWKLLLCTAVLAVSVFAFAGCGDSAKEQETNTEESGSDAADTDEAADTGDADEAVESGEVEIGTVEGNVYTNETFGITCTLGDGWTYATQDELLELSNIVADSVDDEALKETFQNTVSFYVMYALTSDASQSINIVVENLGLMNGLLMSEQDYSDAGKQQLESSAESLGMANLELTQGEAEFAGASHPTMDIAFASDGTTVYERQYYVKANGYMAVITLMSADKADLDTQAAAFSGL